MTFGTLRDKQSSRRQRRIACIAIELILRSEISACYESIVFLFTRMQAVQARVSQVKSLK